MAADLTPCVFCGTPRPLDVARCPTCRRGWIDTHVVAPTPRPSSGQGPEAATGTHDSGGSAGPVTSVPVAAAAASTAPDDSADDTPVDRADDTAGPGEPPETDVAAGTAAAAVAAASTVAEEPAEDPPAEQEEEAGPSEPPEAEVDPAGVPVSPVAAGAAAAGVVASSAPGDPAESSPPEEDDRAGSDGTAEVDVEAAAALASATAAARASSRPGDGDPPNDRPGDRPSNDRPSNYRPVSPAPPAHPIDDASLHLDGADGEPPPPARRGRTGQRLLIAGVVAVLIAAWFGALTFITRDDPAGVSGTTTSPAASTSPALVAGPSTTVPEPTTTTLGATTTTVDPTLLTGPFPEVGNPVDISDLRLGAFAVSPIDFGATEGLGRLVATLGQPSSANTVDDGGFGLCPGEPGFTATWGPFTAVFTGTPEDGALAGYRLENEPAAHPTAGLSTLSELSLGDTIEHLESVYPDFEISYEDIDGSPHFILVRSDGVTLLWGPVSSSEPDGTVLGIYSPEPCEGGPAPSG